MFFAAAVFSAQLCVCGAGFYWGCCLCTVPRLYVIVARPVQLVVVSLINFPVTKKY